MAPGGGRLEGVGGPGVDDANTLGMHLASGLMFASFLMLASKGWVRWLILATIPLILNGIIQTQTRGALVGLFLGGLATIYLKPVKFRRTYYFLACLGILAFITVANETFIARMHTLTAATSDEVEWDSSATSRVEIIKAQLRMFADHPMGVGHQGTAYLSRKYLDERWLASETGDRASHNTVMSVLVDQGLPGIVFILILIVSAWRTLKRMKRMDRSGLDDRLALYRTMLGGSLVTILGAGMFAQNLKAEVWIWNIVLLVVLRELAERSVAAAPDTASEPRIGSVRGRTPLSRNKAGNTGRSAP
jgi:O-antigen ligase